MLECAITGAPDPVRGQVVKATIVLAQRLRPLARSSRRNCSSTSKKRPPLTNTPVWWSLSPSCPKPSTARSAAPRFGKTTSKNKGVVWNAMLFAVARGHSVSMPEWPPVCGQCFFGSLGLRDANVRVFRFSRVGRAGVFPCLSKMPRVQRGIRYGHRAKQAESRNTVSEKALAFIESNPSTGYREAKKAENGNIVSKRALAFIESNPPTGYREAKKAENGNIVSDRALAFIEPNPRPAIEKRRKPRTETLFQKERLLLSSPIRRPAIEKRRKPRTETLFQKERLLLSSPIRRLAIDREPNGKVRSL